MADITETEDKKLDDQIRILANVLQGMEAKISDAPPIPEKACPVDLTPYDLRSVLVQKAPPKIIESVTAGTAAAGGSRRIVQRGGPKVSKKGKDGTQESEGEGTASSGDDDAGLRFAGAVYTVSQKTSEGMTTALTEMKKADYQGQSEAQIEEQVEDLISNIDFEQDKKLEEQFKAQAMKVAKDRAALIENHSPMIALSLFINIGGIAATIYGTNAPQAILQYTGDMFREMKGLSSLSDSCDTRDFWNVQG